MTFESALQLLDKKGFEVSNFWFGVDRKWRAYLRKKGSNSVFSTYGEGESPVDAIQAALGIAKKKQDNFEDLL